MKNAILSFIRHVFTALGAGWALYGGAVRHDELEALCGALLALVGAGWGIYDEWRAARPPAKPKPRDERNYFPQSPLIAAALCLGALTSCASLAPTAERHLDYVRPAVRVAASLALDAAQSAQDLQDKRDLIGGLSTFAGTLMTGEALTAAQIEAALGQWLPAKTHWNTLAAAIAAAADTVRPYLGTDAALWTKFWGQVSLGLADACNSGE
ncbi:MAG: hypothetical protein LBD30_08130 [Verrucomicrobiales bacterium]|jgi:hypothetical protein|nr:hypothetical protein [Verrucomicrobiales bacterium]